ncbi:MAG: TIGR00282 family metallophosphoesterase [Chloroflexi bacterium]|nr:TIGR00282 family metallophosphoesterase [Chloroflexota bacterium]MBU1748414.1 TIGR00282 family metallophosphoesterase [Chloroflexota bacterium]MBU1879762.1 TIGR00282 family metallophosphoesterase [Chloroflexota bacterium]
MRILMIGDVVGRPGRHAVAELLPRLRAAHHVDLVIANGENAAGGRGLTPETARELFACDVDVITSGNHIWRQKEILPMLDSDEPVLRPLNYPAGAPGRGALTWGPVLIVNLLGRMFLDHVDCPFAAVDAILSQEPARCVVVDVHAETTSEKAALAWHLDGRATAVLGTHTHVPTADARILPRGTAFITDVGMVGPRDSILGVRVDKVVNHFRTRLPARFLVAGGPVQFNSVLVEADRSSGRALHITRIDDFVNGSPHER